MANENVEVIPGDKNGNVTEPAPGADKGNVKGQTQTSGNRADTSRVADDDQGGQQNDQGNRGKGTKQFTYTEDRSDWVPRTRLNDESGKRTRLEQDVVGLRRESELRDKRLRLAMGLEVPTKEDQEAQELREGLYRINPKLRLLDRLEEEDIERLLTAAETAESTSQAAWTRHREEQFTNLETEVATLMNVDTLSEAQAARLRRDFRSYAREESAKREKAEQTQDLNYDYRNDFVARYERGDKALLKEFAKSFIDEWVTPARRQVNVSALSRQGRPVPVGGRQRQAVTQGLPKIDYNDDKAWKGALLDARRGGDEGV